MSNDPFSHFAVSFPHFPKAMCSSRLVDPDLWFPEAIRNPEQRAQATENAVQICSSCPYKSQCLQFALDNEIRDGIWGGVVSDERNKLIGTTEKKGLRVQKLENIRILLNQGFTVEQACDEVGIRFTTYERYLQYEKHGWPNTTYVKAKQKLK